MSPARIELTHFYNIECRIYRRFIVSFVNNIFLVKTAREVLNPWKQVIRMRGNRLLEETKKKHTINTVSNSVSVTTTGFSPKYSMKMNIGPIIVAIKDEIKKTRNYFWMKF